MAKINSPAVVLEQAARGRRLDDASVRVLSGIEAGNVLQSAARRRRDIVFRDLVTWSPKVFIPLTELCRDVCHYCTFAKTPSKVSAPYLTPAQVLDIARRGQAAGCHEALFTLGDKPELRYAAARTWLDENGYASTIDYLGAMAKLVFEQTGLLPHLNPGVLSAQDYVELKPHAVSMGVMLESMSTRLCQHGGAHFGSPDKAPDVRAQTIDEAGRAKVAFTTGILIGIGETRSERVEALLRIRQSHEEFGHIQEVIVQNFRAKPGTKMSDAAEPDLDDHLWSIAMARLILPPQISVQAPPNLAASDNTTNWDDALCALVNAGVNDFGGISPVTIDHVNPEAPWPQIERLERAVDAAGRSLAPRLAVYPRYLHKRAYFSEPMQIAAKRLATADGLARQDAWHAGDTRQIPASVVKLITAPVVRRIDAGVSRLLDRATRGEVLENDDVARLLMARGADFSALCSTADALRQHVNGDRVSYVVNRNINYTNICLYHCTFCAFSKGSGKSDLRGEPYLLDYDVVASRAREAWNRGATEICLQGGIHPNYTGDTYLSMVKAVKEAAPDIHVHAFTPLEIMQGASTLDLSVRAYLARLIDAGLGSLPGTSAEILDDSVRRIICPDKLSSTQWLDVMKTAHSLHLPSTATIMFGHVEKPEHQARHLIAIRELASLTRGITELVPLPFVHMQAPVYRRGGARPGPTFTEAIALHAVSRVVLHGVVDNIQASWVKLGPDGVRAALDAGVNDIGGTLMNESITRAAGAAHGEEFTPGAMQSLIERAGREPWQRTTLYKSVQSERSAIANSAKPLDASMTATPTLPVQVFS